MQLLPLCLFFVGVAFSQSSGYEVSKKTFPESFKFGVATSAYQIEGAWNESGKGENIWDNFLHTQPNRSRDEQNGDIACNSYHKWEEDIEQLVKLGVKVYRFSISWTRILPEGETYPINYEGIDYYLNILKKLEENKIDAMVSLYHWDGPQVFFDSDEGSGWLSSSMSQKFNRYAQICFSYFGKYVKYWITINEPKSVCMWGYGTGLDAPGYTDIGEGVYTCVKNVLIAHALAYNTYKIEFSQYGGKVGIALDQTWGKPATQDPLDIQAAETENEFGLGWYANPIFVGNYPQVMIDRIGNRSKLEGYNTSRLPAFTDDHIKYINGTADFFALNLYTGCLVSHTEEAPIGTPSYWNDKGTITSGNSSWPVSTLSWLYLYPEAMRDALNYVNQKYAKGREIWITENGWTDMTGELNDQDRISYYKQYLSALQDSIYKDNVNVTGYTLWSLMDNFEWAEGYTQKFGIIQVDFSSKNRTRTWKESAKWYQNVIATRCLDTHCEN